LKKAFEMNYLGLFSNNKKAANQKLKELAMLLCFG